MSPNTLFYESYSCRYFRTSLFDVYVAMAKLIIKGTVEINDLYEAVGLEKIHCHSGVKWTNNNNPFNVNFDDYIISPTGEVAIYLDYVNQPE